MPSLFITGTDTDVGKTIVTRALLQVLTANNVVAVPYKPIACGGAEELPTGPNLDDYASEDNSDVVTLLNSTATTVGYREINSYTFIHSSTPVFAALDAVRNIHVEKLDEDLVRLQKNYTNILVEGTYGWMTPINKDLSFADWVEKKQMPVILVVGIKEGCANHALLTAQAIKDSGVPLLGWVANRINPGLCHYIELVEMLSQKINAPLLGQIPYIGHPEQKDLTQYIQNPTPLLDFFKR
nr:dethiobiotin synthase [uncultured Haemophilus sp.]